MSNSRSGRGTYDFEDEWEKDERWAAWLDKGRGSGPCGKPGAAQPSASGPRGAEAYVPGVWKGAPAPHVYKSCSHRGTPLFKIGDAKKGEAEVTIGGASNGGLSVTIPHRLLVDCRATRFGYEAPAPREYSGLPEHMLWMKEYLPEKPEKPEKVLLDWTDMGVPPVDGAFFKALIDNFQARGGGHMVFACVGGHGRTGTSIAAVLILKCGYSAEKAICWVREHYCDRVVETDGQVDWLAKLAGRGESLYMPRDKWPKYWTEYEGGKDPKGVPQTHEPQAAVPATADGNERKG